ncbi:hypothetical protein [Amycolatopsis kentuckyensis]|uniref:hypothetical protein n=1 Tax=Amycolatopsis kentuckyensis TaxID=218823 RepID=UPI00142D1FFF|nr:hypothetical protein [Amycolatopsis kentuckyensis]
MESQHSSRGCGPATAASTRLALHPAGFVKVHCPSCGETPATRATRQLVRACRASLATAADH